MCKECRTEGFFPILNHNFTIKEYFNSIHISNSLSSAFIHTIMYIVKVKMCLDCKGVQNERGLCSLYEYIRDILSPVLSFLSKEIPFIYLQVYLINFFLYLKFFERTFFSNSKLRSNIKSFTFYIGHKRPSSIED